MPRRAPELGNDKGVKPVTTIYKDKNGKVIKTDPDTAYHPEGPGPRDADGNKVINGDVVIPEASIPDVSKPSDKAGKEGVK
jgi:hypothetical protein